MRGGTTDDSGAITVTPSDFLYRWRSTAVYVASLAYLAYVVTVFDIAGAFR